ncbi:hypothetical protein [Azospirillum canadense]|uniref:hypothetical protein n=1 Tax=Azospirillum canadense TaxID=403962 RepID=UPI00222628DE|nr:hypothetical protein [Azospirillum canadense]MCW2240352.1 hypothetical protein [Azospirillum canadense]
MPATLASPSTAAAPARTVTPPTRPAARTRRFLLGTLSLAALLATCPAPPSHAAFDLVPSRRPVAPSAAAVAAPPSPAGGPASPAAAGDATDAAPGPVTPARPSAVATVTATPLLPPSSSTPPGQPAPSPAAPAASADSHMVRGRANDVPLAGVIRTIVPPTVVVTPMPPAIATRRVSFTGNGRPWRDVLTESLTRANLTFREDGNHLTVAAASAPSTAVAAAPPTTPPQGGASATITAPTPITPHGQAAPNPTPSAPIQVAPPAPPPSPTPLASAAAPLSVAPPPDPSAAKDGAPPAPTPAEVRVAANAPAPLPFGAAPPADGFEAAQRTRTWTVNPGDSVRSTIARWASSLGLPVPEDKSGYSWSFDYGATVRGKSYFEAVEWLTSGAEDNGIRADWEFSSTTLVTTIKRKNSP